MDVIYLYALIGGLILNFMPCVLPVVLIKLEGVLSNPKGSTLHNLLFSAGIMTIFMILGIMSTFFGMAWGTQFQNEYFLNFIYIIALCMGLQLTGFYSYGISSSWFGGPYVSGLVATLLSTPCTGPFMALPLAWSATATKIEGLLTFICMGLGMCAPYLLAMVLPVHKFMPKPGQWMVVLKEISGYVLLAACIWILSFTENVIFLLSLSLALVLLLKYIPKYKLLALLIILPLCFIKQEKSVETAWIPYSSALVEYLENTNQNYFIDVTADWCLICQKNKPRLEQIKSELNGVLFIRADYTQENEEIRALLKSLDREGLPVYVYWNGKDNIIEDLNEI